MHRRRDQAQWHRVRLWTVFDFHSGEPLYLHYVILAKKDEITEIVFCFSFILYPGYLYEGRQRNLLWRQLIPYFSSTFRNIECRVAELNQKWGN